MSERMESILNAMTILGIVLVSFILVVGVALGIMLAAGVFKEHYDPLVGLKFNKTESQVILDNGGTIELIVTANTAEVTSSGVVITDETVDTNIKLTVRNSRNVIDNTIIEVPSVVKKGEPFVVKAKLAEDGSNKGGTCYINAETSDMMYRVATPIEIKVDVPVEKVTVNAVDASSGKALDIQTTQFIYQDEANLSVTVEPERSLYIFGDKTQKKEITYVSSAPLLANVGYSTGVLEIEYNPSYASDEPCTEPLDTAFITARIQKYSLYDNTGNNIVSSKVELGLYPLQLGQILIKDKVYSDAESVFKTNLFSGSSLKVSAEETGVSGVLNLNVYLEPTIVKSTSSDDYNPLSDLSNLQFGVAIENQNTNAPNAIDVVSTTLTYNGKPVSYWEIKPNRLLEGNEKAYLTIGMLDRSEKFTIKRAISVNEVMVSKNTFEYTNESGTVVYSLNMTIKKTSDLDEEPTGDNKKIAYTFGTGTDAEPTFKKVVTFVAKTSSALTEAPINRNEVNSLILDADETTYQLANYIDDNYFYIQPRGAGSVKICSYLVRTNEAGQPIDAFYNIIDDTKATETGYTNATGFCFVNNIEQAQKGQYIVQQELKELAVTVRETLTDFTFYTSSDFSEDTKVNSIVMGTTNVNKVTLYAKPNSTLAIAESSTAFALGGYSQINIKENEITGLSKIFTSLPGGGVLSSYAQAYKNSGTKYTENYLRWLQFDLSTNSSSESTTPKERKIVLSWNTGVTLDNTASFDVTTIDVPVSYITIDDKTDTTGKYNPVNYGIDVSSDYWHMLLRPAISNTEKVMYAYPNPTETDANNKENRTYYRLTYSNSASGDGDVTIPECKCVASEEYLSKGLIKAPSGGNVSPWLFIFDDSIVSTENPISVTVGETIVESKTLKGVMKLLYSSSTADETKELIWKELARRMDVSVTTSANNASDYVTLDGTTLYIKQALPENHSMYLFYSSTEGDTYTEKFSDFMPIAVHLDYSWPTFTSGVSGYNMDTNVEGELPGEYYIYNADGQNARMFTMDSITTAGVKYFGSGGENVEYTLDVKYGIIINTNYVELNIKNDNSSGEVKSVAEFSLTQSGNSLAVGTEIEAVTITRNVYLVIMSAGNWNSLKNQTDASGFINDKVYNESLSNSFITYSLSTENITFIIKDINQADDSGDTGAV